jgi:hypothetical protein
MSMVSGTAFSTAGLVMLAGFNLEALLMYGMVAFVIGLIAWSKYNEAPPSDPYATERSAEELPETAEPAAVASAAVAVEEPGMGARERV